MANCGSVERIPGVKTVPAPKKSSRVTKGLRKGASVLNSLRPEEAQAVLHRLLAAHPALGAEAEQIAKSLLGEVSFESVADQVEQTVRALSLHDLNRRAGRHEWGYTEPTEAAWELLGEAVDPFLEDMKRQIELGLEAEALEICKGVVLGLYRVRDERGSEFLGWAPDFPDETAAFSIETWCVGGDSKKTAGRTSLQRRRAFPQEFVVEFVPEWDSLIARTLSRGRGANE